MQMAYIGYVCLYLCLSCVLGDMEEQMEHVSSQMEELSEKLDREVSAHQQNMAHMSSILEYVAELLHRVEMCAPRHVPSTPTATPTPTSGPGVDDSWRDEVAQAACTGLQRSKGWMFAVRRNCYGEKTCTDICQSLRGEDSQLTRMWCEDALHVYPGSHPLERELSTSDVETLATKVYRYFSCSKTHCGPNFCCCQGMND